MKEKVAFSIIIPVYNVEKYLKTCLDSIYSQSFKNFEIIAVNDGSTDGSLDILNDYRDKYGKMTVVTQENKGQSVARNVGQSYANGEYICYVDSDDMIFPTMLEKIYDQFDETADLVAYNHIDVEEEFKLCDIDMYKLMGTKNINGSGRDMYMHFANNNKYYHAVWRMCLRKSYLDKISVRFVEGIFYEDIMYTLICYLAAGHMIYIDEPLYAYRMRTGSTMNSRKYEKSLNNYISVLTQLVEYLRIEKFDVALEKCVLDHIGRELIERIEFNSMVLRDNRTTLGEKRNTFDYLYYLKGFKRLIYNASETIVYGAGGIGKMLGRYLKKENMLDYITSYCVTVKKEELQIEGIDVRELEYIKKFDKDILIIIAANATAGEMEKKLIEYGYYNYIIVDKLLEYIINDALIG